MGDTILLTSALENLVRTRPDCKIWALVPGAFAPVLEGNPHLQEVWLSEEGLFALRKKAKQIGFDGILYLHSSRGFSLLPHFLATGKKFFHVHDDEAEKRFGGKPNALEWDAFAFQEYFGESSRPGVMPAPKVFLSAEEKKQAEGFWAPWGLQGKQIVFLGLGASRATKRWTPENFARFAFLCKERAGLFPAFCIGPGEEEESFASYVIDCLRVSGLRPKLGMEEKGDFLHLSGFPLRKLMIALSTVKAYVGNDSGPKHLAAALGIPTYTIFGPEDPREWHPYSLTEHPLFFTHGLACRTEDQGRWCGIPECVKEQHRCMTSIEADSVYATFAKGIA